MLHVLPFDEEGNYYADAWPSPHEFAAIFRGLSALAKKDSRYPITFHLARGFARRNGVPIQHAYDRMYRTIAQRVYLLALELRLDASYAVTAAGRVYHALLAIDHAAYGGGPVWLLDARDWLAIDRAAAVLLGFPVGATVSATLGALVAPQRRRGFTEAKRYVHDRMAHHAAEFLRECDVDLLTAWVLRRRLEAWLNGFDR